MDVKIDVDILVNIKALRLSKGYSQEYMASKLGIAQNNYGKLERGEINLTTKRLIQISEIFEMNTGELALHGIVDKVKDINELKDENNELNNRIMKLEKLLENSVFISEIEKLSADILKKAKKGEGLVYLDYDFIGEKFRAIYTKLNPNIDKKSIMGKISTIILDEIIEDSEEDNSTEGNDNE